MRRSKMLLILEKELYREPDRYEDMDPRVRADRLLSVIEKAGMLPPPIIAGKFYSREDADYINDIVYEWEK